jgi:cytochrome P450
VVRGNSKMTFTLQSAGSVFTDPSAYADERRFHEACTLLRRESPVHRVEEEHFNPFWALTRHAEVLEVERDNLRFINAPRPLLQRAFLDRRDETDGRPLRTLIHMDDPDHRVYRKVAADWFHPRSLRILEDRIKVLARRFVDEMAERDGECDFVRDVALNFPLYVILSLLGLPESDFPRMLKLTQELFGGEDAELQRSVDPEVQLQVILDFLTYFNELTTERRAHPTEDLASTLANARIDGEYLPDLDLASYYVIIATAGHDTTSSTIAGGLQALIQNPEQLALLRSEPALMANVADEMIRWVTPVKQFMRTATEDYVLAGTTIAAGDSVYLAYLSANRDEAIFTDPFRFDVRREANRHLAFGFGAHFCLGAQLARMETRLFFTELIGRLDDIEITGDAPLSSTLFVGGLKRLPIRYRIRPAVSV